MGKARRSGRTAGETLPLQLHIAGPQKGVGPLSRTRGRSPQTTCGPAAARREAVVR